MKLKRGSVCDLCHHQQPSLYCSSDSAFLCFDCDYQVHTANFLVARHIRVSICSDDALSSSSSTDNKTCSVDRRKKTLVSWCSRLGVARSSVIEVAFQVWCVNRSFHNYRVGLAASIWLGITKHMKRTKQLLKRLEEVSGVPAKSIVVQHLKLEAKLKQHQPQEEGWAENI